MVYVVDNGYVVYLFIYLFNVCIIINIIIYVLLLKRIVVRYVNYVKKYLYM